MSWNFKTGCIRLEHTWGHLCMDAQTPNILYLVSLSASCVGREKWRHAGWHGCECIVGLLLFVYWASEEGCAPCMWSWA